MSKPRVLVTRRLPEAAENRLREHCDATFNDDDRHLSLDELTRRLADCRGMVCLLTDRIPAGLLDTAPALRVIANVAVGYNNIDVAAATERGILVTNTPGVLTDTTADLAFALLMAAARRLPEADRFVRAGRFHGWELDMLLGVDVHRATLGVVGLGRIGRGVARRGAGGFDMRVLYHDVERAIDLEQSAGYEFCDLDDLLRRSDFVSLHVPLTEGTHHLIGPRELDLMKPDAVLVNASRGPVVDEAALAERLADGRLRAAGLDVFENEPEVHPGLLALENAVLVPHIGSASVATRTRMTQMAVDNLLAALNGETPPQLVNPEALGVTH